MVLSGTERCKCLGMISYDIKGHGSAKTLKHTSTVILFLQTNNILILNNSIVNKIIFICILWTVIAC